MQVIPIGDSIPTRRAPVVTLGLIAVNAVAFLWQYLVVGLEPSVYMGGVIPIEILTLQDLPPPDLVPPPFTILTSMFLHGGFAHVAGNMLFLWIFGNNVEDELGRGRFLLFYIGCGLAAALAQLGVSAAAQDLATPMVGASGAIAGVLAAYVAMFPGAPVTTWIPPLFVVRLRAGIFIGVWFAMQLIGALFGGGHGGGVAFTAHVAGFVAGWIWVKLRPPRRRTG